MAVNLIQGKQIATASWSQNAVTASYAPAYLPLTGGTIDGNVTVNGTASIAFLSVAIESASVIYSSGSNIFGDATNDTQRLNGTVIVSGSQQITGSLAVVNTTPRIILRNSGSGASGQIVFTAIDDTFTNKSVGTTVFSTNITDSSGTVRGGIVYTKASNTSTNTSFNYNDFANTAIYISGSGNVGIRTTTPTSASLHVNGNVWASSFTGSLSGTASFAVSSSRAVTSSFTITAQTASFVTGSNVFGPFGSNSIISASFAVSASWAPTQNINTSSFATTGSNIFIGNQAVTGSVTATQGFITNWGTDASRTALFGTDYPFGVNNRQILFNDISNNDFTYQSQSIGLLANVEEGFGVTLGGDPNGTPVSSNISTTLGSSKIENTSGTTFGRVETSPDIVTIRTDNGGYQQLIQLKSDNIQNVVINNGTSEENTLTIQTNRTYTTKYIETDEGFIGSYLQAPSITGSLLGTASFAVSSSRAVTASYALNGGVTQLLAGPNITLSPTNGLGQVTISSTSGGGGFNTATGSYGSFYDTTTQTNPVANIPRSMSLNMTDITNGVSISGSTSPFNTYIKTENAGVYNIQFSAQVDKTDGGTDDVVIWLRKNGIDLTDTATTLTLPTNNSKAVAAWNWFVTSAANDYYQIIWLSADTDMRLFAEVAGGGHPGIPSVIVTANRVDQFLSNTGSFSGSFTGQFTGSLYGTGSIYLFKDIISTGSIDYTLQQQDTGRILQFTSSAATTITIPPNLQVGSRFEGKQLGTGQLTFVTGSGVTLRTAATENAKTAERYSVFAIDWIGAEEYMLYGRLEQA